MIQLPLHPDLAPVPLPAKHYAWFRTANSHPSNHWKKTWWFPFKEKFLARYGVMDSYDLQIIERECYNCEGEGCHRCDDGVYFRSEVPLQRWLFPNGDVYHKPVPFLPAGRPSIYKSTIKGLIRHADASEAASIRAALRLFLRYDRSLFLSLARATYGDTYWLAKLSPQIRHVRCRLYVGYLNLRDRLFERDRDEVPF